MTRNEFLCNVDVAHAKAEDEQQQQQQQSIPEDTSDPAAGSVLGKNLMSDDDLKGSYPIDAPVRVISYLCFLMIIQIYSHDYHCFIRDMTFY